MLNANTKIKHGDLVRMTSFTAHLKNVRISYRCNPKEVSVFMYMGEETRDGVVILNYMRRMHELGWMPIDPRQQKKFFEAIKK